MRLILVFLLLANLHSAYGSDTLKVDFKLSNVTVFFEGAEIFGQSELRLNQGVHIIQINGFPASLDPSSFKVQGHPDILIHSVNHEVVDPNPFEDLELKKLQEQISAFEKTQVSLASKYEVYSTEHSIILENSKLSNGDQSLNANQIREAADMFRKRLMFISQEQAKIISDMESNIQEIEVLRRKVNRLLDTLNRQSISLYVKVENKKPFNRKLEFSFYTPLAGWSPEYDIRIDDLNGPLELVYKASVYQSSGIDWDNTFLKLSTEDPSQNREAPNLQPWRLPNPEQASKYEEPIQATRFTGRFFDDEGKPLSYVNLLLKKDGKSVIRTSTDASGKFSIKPLKPGQYELIAEHFAFNGTSEYIALSAPETNRNFTLYRKRQGIEGQLDKVKSSKVTTAEDISNMAVRDVSNQRLGILAGVSSFNERKTERVSVPLMAESSNNDISNLVYEINKRQSIPSNGKDYSINMLLEKVAVNYTYEVVPKLDPRAFLVAEIDNWEELKLLAGPARMYLMGNFVGSGNIDVSSIKDTLSLYLGQDKGINIQRKLGKELKSEGIFGGRTRKSMNWQITVRNLKNENIRVKVVDQVPLSDKDYIKVEVLDLGGAKYDDRTGELYWLLELGASEQKVLEFSYQVEYPETISISKF